MAATAVPSPARHPQPQRHGNKPEPNNPIAAVIFLSVLMLCPFVALLILCQVFPPSFTVYNVDCSLFNISAAPDHSASVVNATWFIWMWFRSVNQFGSVVSIQSSEVSILYGERGRLASTRLSPLDVTYDRDVPKEVILTASSAPVYKAKAAAMARDWEEGIIKFNLTVAYEATVKPKYFWNVKYKRVARCPITMGFHPKDSQGSMIGEPIGCDDEMS